MLENPIGTRTFSVALLAALCSCLASGCDDSHGRFYDYGPSYGHEASGAIRFEWSLPGSTDAATSDDDAGAIEKLAPDGGRDADAGAKTAQSVNQSVCDALGAAQFQALLFDQGTIVAAFQARCGLGSRTFRVRSNDYTATAALVTKEGVPVTETELIPSFVVAPGETQLIQIAFSKLANAP